MCFQTDLSLQNGMDAVGSNDEIRLDGRTVRERQLHAAIGFAGPRQAVTKMKCAFGLRVGQKFLKFCAMHIVRLNTWRGACREIHGVASRSPKQEACDRHTYLLDAVCKADPLQQKRRVRMDGNSSANLAQFDSLFKDGDLQPTLPQGECGRQATNSAAHDRNLKLL